MRIFGSLTPVRFSTLLILIATGCSSSDHGTDGLGTVSTGGAASSGIPTGGARATGGNGATGGALSSTPATGGSTIDVLVTGGAQALGGKPSFTGGAWTVGGSSVATGGTMSAGSATTTGGSSPKGGSSGLGGVSSNGGKPGTGGTPTGGAFAGAGGRSATGGTFASSGGKSSSGGALTGGTSSAGGSPTTGGVISAGGATVGGSVATGGTASAAGSTGVMHAANGQIYDATGQPFLPWGVNKVHIDQGNPGLELMNPNAVRVNLYFRLPNTTTTNMLNRLVQNHIVIIPGRWEATCTGDTAAFTTGLASEVDAWVAEAAAWKAYERISMINIANEAGPGNSTVWREQYITAVQRMRTAGYAGLLMVDSGGCGQDVNDIVQYGAAVLAGDPLHNIVFSLHVYGNAQNRADIDGLLNQIKTTGLSAIIGEFGPGRNVGPSPTMIRPEDVMASAMANGFGTLAWAADDNNLSNSMADDNWFSLLYDLGVPYTGQDSQLTLFGKVVVNDPTVGLVAVAQKANGF